MPEIGNKDKVKCPYCGSMKVWKRGFQPSITGLKRRCQCYDCGKTFYKPKEAAKMVKVAKTVKAVKGKTVGKKAKRAKKG